MKKYIFLISAAILLFCAKGKAQPQLYYTAIGLNAAYNYGITLKHYLNHKNMIEGIVNFNYGAGTTLLYEFNNRHPFNVDELDWYYGIGGHVKALNGRRSNVFYNDRLKHLYVGLDAVLGLEYTLKETPLNLGINVKPELNFITNNMFWIDGGITIRYVLK
ncbi:MAG: hypothetical protein IT238_05805 [Bacteroidia bacterium]|nr:hypothetical protein [Bacteroidia bacterium]MCZ2247320.1 hypothetical protein [Bacteroidia bacterium]